MFLANRSHRFWLTLIVILAIVVRFAGLSQPRTYIFDEVYHAVTAKLIARNDPRAYEWWNPPIEPNTAVDWLHPPYAKYTQALGMLVFGENSFGWRVSAALFGILVIVATEKLAWLLFHHRRISLVAAALAGFDGLLLVQSRIAMNDIHVTFFLLLTCIAYLRSRASVWQKKTQWWQQPQLRWMLVTGVCAGIAVGTKWSGVFGLGIVILSETITMLLGLKDGWPKKRQWALWFVSFLILPITFYLLSYSQMFLQGKSLVCLSNQVEANHCYCHQDSSWWVTLLSRLSPSKADYWQSLEARGGCARLISHFSELHHQIWWYQTHLTATHTYQSRPWQWFLDLRPVWFHTQNTATSALNIYTFGNPVLFWLGDGAVVATLLFFLWNVSMYLLEPKRTSLLPWQLWFLFGSYCAVWLPWQLSPRIMFFYHYTPAVPLLAILLAFWLAQLPKKISYAVLFVCASVFCLWLPNWLGIAVPMRFAEQWYFFFPSWR